MKKIITIIILLVLVGLAVWVGINTSMKNRDNAAAVAKAGVVSPTTVDTRVGTTKQVSGVTNGVSTQEEKTGCDIASACNYDATAKSRKNSSCKFAWYQTKNGTTFSPNFYNSSVDTKKINEIRQSLTCSGTWNCTTELFVKKMTIDFDEIGNPVLTHVYDPVLHAYVSADKAKSYTGTNACVAAATTNSNSVSIGEPTPKEQGDILTKLEAIRGDR